MGDDVMGLVYLNANLVVNACFTKTISVCFRYAVYVLCDVSSRDHSESKMLIQVKNYHFQHIVKFYEVQLFCARCGIYHAARKIISLAVKEKSPTHQTCRRESSVWLKSEELEKPEKKPERKTS